MWGKVTDIHKYVKGVGYMTLKPEPKGITLISVGGGLKQRE